MKHRIKIIHLMDRAIPGGAENGIIRRISKLDSDKYDIRVCVLLRENSYIDAFRSINIPVYSLYMRHNKEFSGMLKLYKYLKNEKPCILHTHFTNSDFYGIIFGRILRIPIIVSTFHMMRDWRKINSLKSKIRHMSTILTARMFDRILTVSDSVRQSAIQFDKLPDKKVTTIFNGIDISLYQANRIKLKVNEFRINSDTKIIGTVGRLCLEKGQKSLIEAFSKINAKFTNSKLVIVGEGELRAEIEEYIVHNGLGDSVQLTGFRADIAEVLSQFDLFVLPSLTEGMPNALIEAMASGLPCIASNIASCSELIENEVSGFLTQTENSDEIAEKVLFLLENEDLAKKIGEAGREVIEKNYNIIYTAKNLAMIYSELTSLKSVIK